MFTGRTDAEAPILWQLDAKSNSLEKTLMLGRIEGRKRRGAAEDKMVGWHHRVNGHEFEQALEDAKGQGSLVCCSPWSHKESDRTKWTTTRKVKKCVSLRAKSPLPTTVPTELGTQQILDEGTKNEWMNPPAREGLLGGASRRLTSKGERCSPQGGGFQAIFFTLTFVLWVYLTGEYSRGQIPSSNPSAVPVWGTLICHPPCPLQHSLSSACSSRGRCINKLREKVTQLANTEQSCP